MFTGMSLEHGLQWPKGEIAMAEWNYEEWAEKAGIENLKHRLATGDVLLAQANTLLSILLVGVGSALGLAIKLLEPVQQPGVAVTVWGAAATTVWLACVAAILVWRCIATRETEVPYNAPKNIYKPELGLSEKELRAYEMENIQSRINFTADRNQAVAYWLDRCRYAAIFTPAVFAFAAWVAGRMA